MSVVKVRARDMNWWEARRHYIGQWPLIEVIETHSEDDRRILDDVPVVAIFEDSGQAIKEYASRGGVSGTGARALRLRLRPREPRYFRAMVVWDLRWVRSAAKTASE